jgi:hypothetical protein
MAAAVPKTRNPRDPRVARASRLHVRGGRNALDRAQNPYNRASRSVL